MFCFGYFKCHTCFQMPFHCWIRPAQTLGFNLAQTSIPALSISLIMLNHNYTYAGFKTNAGQEKKVKLNFAMTPGLHGSFWDLLL